MDRLAHKLLAMLVIFTAIFTSTALPIKVSTWFESRGRRGRAILSAIMCFGGGVFLGTFLLHMTPEVDELMAHSMKDVKYPVAHLIIGVGFFFMLFLERSTMELQKWKEHRTARAKGTSDNQASLDGEALSNKDQTQVAVIAVRTAQHTAGTNNHSLSNGHTPNVGDNKKCVVQKGPVESPPGDGYLAHGYREGHSHGGPDQAGELRIQGSAARSVILLLALSIDSFFEGLSLGLQYSVSGVWRMVLAILSHEIAVAFSLGLRLKLYSTAKRTLLMAFSYGMMSPIGITIGTAFVEGVDSSMNIDLVNGILLGITAGVFLYVAFFEILLHEITHESSITNLLSVFVGFGMMAILLIVHIQAEGSNEPTPTPEAPDNKTMASHWGAWWVGRY